MYLLTVETNVGLGYPEHDFGGFDCDCDGGGRDVGQLSDAVPFAAFRGSAQCACGGRRVAHRGSHVPRFEVLKRLFIPQWNKEPLYIGMSGWILAI